MWAKKISSLMLSSMSVARFGNMKLDFCLCTQSPLDSICCDGKIVNGFGWIILDKTTVYYGGNWNKVYWNKS